MATRTFVTLLLLLPLGTYPIEVPSKSPRSTG